MQPDEAAVEKSAESRPRIRASGLWRGLVSPAFLIVFATALISRLLFLARKPFWFDECFSAAVADLDAANFVHLLWWREANMSLYYLLLRLWMQFGHSESFIRGLSVAASLATLPAIYWLGSLLFGRRAGLIAAALLSVNAYHIRYAQEARSYTLFVLLATMSSAFFVANLGTPSRTNRVAYILTSVLAVYAHFYALLLVVAHVLCVRVLPDIRGVGVSEANVADNRAAFRAQMRSAWISIGISVLPLLVFIAKTGAGPIRWIRRPGLSELLQYYENMAGNGGLTLLALYVIGIAASVAPVGRKLLSRAKSAAWEIWANRFLLIWLLFPALLTLALSLARPLFLGRYLIFCLPALILLAAAGLARIQQMWRLATILAAFLLFSLGGTLSYYDHDFDSERDAAGIATAYVLGHAQPGDGILFYIPNTRVAYEFFRSHQVAASPTTEPANARGPEILFPHHADRLDYRDFTGKPTREFVLSLPSRSNRVWVMLMNNGPPSNPDPTTLMLTQALGESFPMVERWQFPLVELRLYGRK
jgi:mannosyltransferase